MAEHNIKAAGRKDEGKGASRRLRHAGLIPAVIYGGEAAPQSIQLEHEKTWLQSQNEWFYSSIIDLDIDGKVQKALLRDIQRHPYKQIIMHIDFQRVDENKALRTSVPLHFLNEEKSPAGKAAEVVVTHELTEVEIECLPKDLPEFIEVDLSELTVGTILHMSDIKLPAGVSIPELKLGKEHDLALVIAKHGKEEAEAAAAPAPTEVPAAKVTKKDQK
jgi:large subunit ribosomal protein L25